MLPPGPPRVPKSTKNRYKSCHKLLFWLILAGAVACAVLRTRGPPIPLSPVRSNSRIQQLFRLKVTTVLSCNLREAPLRIVSGSLVLQSLLHCLTIIFFLYSSLGSQTCVYSRLCLHALPQSRVFLVCFVLAGVVHGLQMVRNHVLVVCLLAVRFFLVFLSFLFFFFKKFGIPLGPGW